MWEIANILKTPTSLIENHLHQFGYVNHFDVWIPHKLSNRKIKNLLDHISACNSLLKHNENIPFLKQIVTGSGYFIIMWNGRNRGGIEMSYH